MGRCHPKKKGRKGSHNLAINRGVLLLILVSQIPKKSKRNIFKHVVILNEKLAPQYGYYGFVLLRDISQDYVFRAWVRENLFLKVVVIIFHIVNIFSWLSCDNGSGFSPDLKFFT